MADGRPVISSEPHLSAGVVAGRRFNTTFRGFDPEEVRRFLRRLSEEMAAAEQRERKLLASVEELRQQASRPVLDEVALESMLGEETTRILRSAREAAADIRARSEEKVARLVAESEEHAAQVRAQAEEESARLRSEAEAVLAVRVEEAEGVAQELLAAAHAEAEAEIERARALGKEMVSEAQLLRERVLADLARRRRAAHIQIEQLRAGRDRLLDAYRLVRRTLDEATQELSVAESEARLVAEAAGRRLSDEPELSIEELEAELEAARGTSLLLGDPLESQPPLPPGETALPGPGADFAGGPDSPTPVAPIASVASVAPAAPVAPVAPVASPPAYGGAEPGAEEPTLVPVDPGSPDEGVRILSAAEVADLRAPAPAESPTAEAPPAPAVAPAPLPDPAPPAPAPSPLAPAGPSRPAARSEGESGGPSVEELFARIKADRADAVVRARERLGAEPVGGSPEASEASEGPASGSEAAAEAPPVVREPVSEVPVSDADERALQARDSQIGPLETALARKLKRVLQDEQNEVLESLRTIRGRPTGDAVLAAEEVQLARYREAARPLLCEAILAASATSDADSSRLAQTSAENLAAELVSELRTRLVSALEDASDISDNGAVVEGVSAVYRQCKTRRVEALTRHHLAATFTLGAFHQTPDGLALRWVVDDEGGACPDCDDNALAGPTAKGQTFPTGQLHPPAHVGCRCLLVAAQP
ncbi:MAG: DivIVA domain-containing protein [Acidimicrobiales bacterium]